MRIAKYDADERARRLEIADKPRELYMETHDREEILRALQGVYETSKAMRHEVKRQGNGVLIRWYVDGCDTPAPIGKPCAQCGDPIPAGKKSTAVYCSLDCLRLAESLKRKRERIESRKCAWCEGPIVGRKSTSIYCSLKCRTRQATMKRDGPIPVDRFCAHCAKPLSHTARRHKKTCGPRCKFALLYRKKEFRERCQRNSRETYWRKARRSCLYCGKPLTAESKFIGTCSDSCTRSAGQVKRQNERRAA